MLGSVRRGLDLGVMLSLWQFGMAEEARVLDQDEPPQDSAKMSASDKSKDQPTTEQPEVEPDESAESAATDDDDRTVSAAEVWPDLDADESDEHSPEWPDEPAEEVKPELKPEPEPEVAESPVASYEWPGQDDEPATEPEPKALAEPEPLAEVGWPVPTDPNRAAEQESLAEPESEPEPEPEPETESEPDSTANPEPEPLPGLGPEPEAEPDPVAVAEAEPVAQSEQPRPESRPTPVAATETTRFLPRVPPPPAASVESTQIIPAIRAQRPAAPMVSAESTQIIPAIRDESDAASTQHIPPIQERAKPVRIEPPTTIIDPGEIDEAETDGAEQAEQTPKPKRRLPKTARRLLVAAGVIVLVLAVCGALVVTQPSIAHRLGFNTVTTPTTAPPAAPVAFVPQLKPLDADAPTPTPTGVTAAIGTTAASPVLGTFNGTVIDAATGTVLWDHGASTGMLPASTNKVLTSAAALLTLGPEASLHTTVVAGTQPGTIVLVGGGDPTLTALPESRQSVYPGAPRIADLATQVRAHTTEPITHIVVDISRYTGTQTGPGWDQETAAQDNYAPIQPVMLDGGRLDPTKPDVPRTYQPALAAGQALADRLGIPTSSVSLGMAPAGAAPIADVHSATVPDLVMNMLQISDNVLAEVLGHEVAIATGHQPTFAGSTQAVLEVLQRNGFDPTGASLADDSGLSPNDRLPPGLLAQVLRVAASADATDPRVAKLRPLLFGLPIAGSPVGDATLAGRYLSGPSAPGRGWVRAKTGTLSALGVNALAGVVLDADNRVLVFVLMSSGSPATTAVPPMLDTIAATLRGCGCR